MEQAPVDRQATLALARRARRLLVKVGSDIVRFGADRPPITEAAILAHLVHEDGLMRVPVLVLGDLVVRGFTEALYGEALD